MANEGLIIVPGSDTSEPMWTEPDPPTYDYSGVDKGFVFRREGAGQLDWGPTGIGLLGGQTFMVTPQYIGIPEGPSLTTTTPAEKTLTELLTYSEVGATGMPAFGPRIDDLDDYYGDDQGEIPERDMSTASGFRPQKFVSTTLHRTSTPQDMGVRKMKNVQSVEIETSLTCPIYVGILARTSPQQPFNEVPVWSVIKHPVQRAGFNVGGIEFLFLLFAKGYGVGEIGTMTVCYKLMDQTGLHSKPTLLRGAS